MFEDSSARCDKSGAKPAETFPSLGSKTEVLLYSKQTQNLICSLHHQNLPLWSNLLLGGIVIALPLAPGFCPMSLALCVAARMTL